MRLRATQQRKEKKEGAAHPELGGARRGARPPHMGGRANTTTQHRRARPGLGGRAQHHEHTARGRGRPETERDGARTRRLARYARELY
jgi:hypothetical protein